MDATQRTRFIRPCTFVWLLLMLLTVTTYLIGEALFLALADVLASPRAKGQNTPFKIFTYIASGKPLVATRIPTHTQLLDDSTAFLVEPTPRALASGLQAALDRPEDAGARARAARELVERAYSVERYREKIARAYATVERLVAG